MRSIMGALLSVLSTGMIVVGLYLSLPDAPGYQVLEQPNHPARISGKLAQTVAYFQYAPDGLELVMIVSQVDEGETPMFKTRVRLADGQTHTLAIGGEMAGAIPEQFSFLRVGNTIRMSVTDPAQVMSAGLRQDWD